MGIVAANAWYDPETETFSGFEFAGLVILAIDPIEWPSGSEATFDLQDTLSPPGTTEIAIYAHDENIAAPLSLVRHPSPITTAVGISLAKRSRLRPVASSI